VSNHILDSLGLTKEKVQKALGLEDRPKTVVEKKNYLFAQDQRRIRRRLKQYNNFITARFYEGYRPSKIAKMLNVSEESVRSRLRKQKMFGQNKKAGRPKNRSSKQSCSLDRPPVQDQSYLVETIYLNQSPTM